VPAAQNADDALRLNEAMQHKIGIAHQAPQAGARPQQRIAPAQPVQ